MKRLALGILPVALLGTLILLFLSGGSSRVFRPAKIPVEKLSFERVVLRQDEIVLTVVNDGRDAIVVSQVIVNDAYWAFTVDREGSLERLGKAKIRIPYPWNEGEPQRIKVVTGSGLGFEKEIEAAFPSPEVGGRYLGTLALLGVYVGVLPVFIGMLWLPFLRNLRSAWFAFLLSFTVGLLFFLGVDSVVEGVKTAGAVPETLKGFGVFALGFAAAFLGLFSISRGGQPSESGGPEGKQRVPFNLALAVAFGIGVHNLGEGLAVGGAYAIGEIALGALLVVGFMVHNVTEGIAIVAPVSKGNPSLTSLAALGALAGGPTIFGAWFGGFAYSALWASLFFGIGAGAIFQIVFEIAGQMSKGWARDFFTASNAAGFVLGMLVMYSTGLFVSA
jgi:zinc transporter ZupT